MINTMKTILPIFLLIIFISCNEDIKIIKPVGEEMIYPLTVGNKWSYVRLFSIFNSRPYQSDVIPPEDYFIIDRSVVTISQIDTLQDTIVTFRFRDVLYGSGNTFIGEAYYNYKEDGLYFYAYRGGGHAVPKATSHQKIYFQGRFFNSVREITSLITDGEELNSLPSDSLRFEDPPLKSLPRTYRIGEQWIYRTTGKPFKIEKRVLSKETIDTHRGSFECYKVQWLIDFDNDGHWNEEVEFFDWISPQGLVRRSVSYKDMLWIQDNPEPISKFDSRDEYYLIGLNVR